MRSAIDRRRDRHRRDHAASAIGVAAQNCSYLTIKWMDGATRFEMLLFDRQGRASGLSDLFEVVVNDISGVRLSIVIQAL